MLWYGSLIFLGEGERDRAEGLWRQAEELATRTHEATVTLDLIQRDAVLAMVNGRLEEAVSILQRLVTRGDELGMVVRGRQFSLLMLRPYSHISGAMRSVCRDIASLPEWQASNCLPAGDRTHGSSPAAS